MERECATERDFKAEYVARVLNSPSLPKESGNLGTSAYWEVEDAFAVGENPGSIVHFVEMDPLRAQELERSGKVIPFHREKMPHRNLVAKKITEREIIAASLLASATTVGYVAWRKGWIKKAWELAKRVVYSGKRLNI